MERTYAEYAARQAMELLAIDSPTGFTARAADWVQRAFEELGYTARRTAKGAVSFSDWLPTTFVPSPALPA